MLVKKINDKDRKNCNNCDNLEYEWGDVNDPEGFVCSKRYENIWNNISFYAAESFLDKLENDNYRYKSKKCFEKSNKG